ncbi:MAG: hypothetical protein KDB03_23220 [Planctomycetales bacterium]|nr:hypothetical protein [Planctomycetales bacterium]
MNSKILSSELSWFTNRSVNAIVSSRSTNVRQIEQTLDGLLDFAGSEGGLRLFKSLCRYYWQIDQAATASYIHSYRDLWDNEESDTPQKSNPEAV